MSTTRLSGAARLGGFFVFGLTACSTFSGNGDATGADGGQPDASSDTGSNAVTGSSRADPPYGVAAIPVPPEITVSTFAGAGTGPSLDGTGVLAQFDGLYQLTIDSNDVLFLTQEFRVRKITPAGVVTTPYVIADGAGDEYSDVAGICAAPGGKVFVSHGNNPGPFEVDEINPSGDGTYTRVTSGGPMFARGLAADATGNLFITDYLSSSNTNNMIWRVSSGVATFLAGGARGNVDGNGISAQFNIPIAITVDSAGTAFVVDYGNNSIRKLTATGEVTTLAGSTKGFADGIGKDAHFSNPSAVAMDGPGAVVIGDWGNARIRRVTVAGVVTTIAGSTTGYSDGPGPQAQFDRPLGVAVDSAGSIFVADQGNGRIRKITRTHLGEIAVSWRPPTDASLVTGYAVTAVAAGQPTKTCMTAATSCPLTGLARGVSYEVSVVTVAGATRSDPSELVEVAPN